MNRKVIALGFLAGLLPLATAAFAQTNVVKYHATINDVSTFMVRHRRWRG